MNEIKGMRFACLVQKRKTEIREREIKKLNDDQVLVKQLTCNICTTDYQQWQGLREHVGYPTAGGHEVSGIIVGKGEKISNLEIGDFVARVYDRCGSCSECLLGNFMCCENIDKLPQKTNDGYRVGYFGFADYNIYNARSLIKMNSDLDPGEASFLEPVATVIHGIKKLSIKPMDDVVVIGAGTMGIINAQIARLYGARVIVAELIDKKLNCAKNMGFDVIDVNHEDILSGVMRLTNNQGVDSVIPAVGNSEVNKQSLIILKKQNGKVLFFSSSYPVVDLPGDANALHYSEIQYIGTYGATRQDFQYSAKLLNSKAINVSSLIESKRFVLSDIQEAFKLASAKGMYRVSVLLNE